MFEFLKGKKKGGEEIGAPVTGEAVPIQKVNDPTFADELLGKGVAVIPSKGEFYAPADGEIAMIFETMHAFTMTTKSGAELLVHVGLDTVMLKGKYYEMHKKTGDAVKKGDLILTVNLEKVKEAGYDVMTPMVICNSDDFQQIEPITGMVHAQDTVLKITK